MHQIPGVIIISDERCTQYRTMGHPEKPQRVSRTIDLLRRQKVVSVEWESPAPVNDEQLLRAHAAGHLGRLKVAQDFDGDTAWFPEIDQHARRGVGGALRALQLAREGKAAFSLLRPPGHHATRDHAMGFCYLSSMAIAILEARATGVKRAAVLDFDVHHGNGTEDILVDRPGVLFCSVHQSPCYPGTGLKDVGNNCFNFPVAPGTPRLEWRKVIGRALEKIREFQPEVIGVSAGFDAYSKDPLANGTLEREDFVGIGEELRRMKIPVFSVLEGGYSVDLPELILGYLCGLEGVTV